MVNTILGDMYESKLGLENFRWCSCTGNYPGQRRYGARCQSLASVTVSLVLSALPSRYWAAAGGCYAVAYSHSPIDVVAFWAPHHASASAKSSSARRIQIPMVVHCKWAYNWTGTRGVERGSSAQRFQIPIPPPRSFRAHASVHPEQALHWA